eukprot:12012-Eustigmatos_ZCMA.PRE.1
MCSEVVRRTSVSFAQTRVMSDARPTDRSTSEEHNCMTEAMCVEYHAAAFEVFQTAAVPLAI